MSTWDVIVIGAGAAGENAAQYAIQNSERTAALVEHELVGGECSYWACMPSKVLLRPVELLDTARAVPGIAQMLSGSLDLGAVLKRRDSFTHDHDDSSQVEWAKRAGIDVVKGTARLAGEKTVELTASDGSTRTLEARQAVVVATGTIAAVPPVAGLRKANPWTSRDVTNMRELPERVLVVGEGVVACESSTWLNGLGAREVTVVEIEPSLLGGHEPFAGECIAEHFAERGIKVLVGTKVESVERARVEDTGIGKIHGGPAELTADGQSFEVDEIVVARAEHRTADLGLERSGSTTARTDT